MIARSTTETEYRAMALAISELVWVKQLICELKFCEEKMLLCDYQAAPHNTSNPDFMNG